MDIQKDGNVYDLFLPVLENYAADSAVFLKALQITKAYEDRADFPFSFDQLNDATEAVLGIGVHDMAQAAALYRSGRLATDVEQASEAGRKAADGIDEKTRQRFLKELRAFCLTLDELMTRLYSGAIKRSAEGLGRVLVLENPEPDGRHIVRIIRTGGDSFDLSLSPKEALFLAEALSMIAQGTVQPS